MEVLGTPHRRRALEIFALLACLAAGFFIADKMLFEQKHAPSMPKPDCMLSTVPCQFDNASVTLSDDFAKPLLPSNLDVELVGYKPDHLMLELEGVEMNMGVYKLKLSQNDAGSYSGELMLPICMDAKMTWRGTISSPDESISLPVDVRMAR